MLKVIVKKMTDKMICTAEQMTIDKGRNTKSQFNQRETVLQFECKRFYTRSFHAKSRTSKRLKFNDQITKSFTETPNGQLTISFTETPNQRKKIGL